MTHEEMEQTLRRLAEFQQANQQLLRETVGTINKLEAIVEAFILRSPNRGKQES